MHLALHPYEAILLALAAYFIGWVVARSALLGAWPGQDATGKRTDEGSGLRARIDRWSYHPDGTDRTFLRGKVGDLLACAVCSGTWATIVLYVAWVTTAGRWGDVAVVVHVVQPLALAGAVAFLATRYEAP